MKRELLHVFYFLGIYAYVVLKDEVMKTEDELMVDLKGMVKKKVSSFAQPDVIVVSWYTAVPLERFL